MTLVTMLWSRCPPAVVQHLSDAIRGAGRAVGLDRLVTHRRMHGLERAVRERFGREARVRHGPVSLVVGETPPHVHALLEVPLEWKAEERPARGDQLHGRA